MARLKAGEKPVPHTERMRMYRANLEREGGKRLTVDLPPDATKAMNTIMQARSVTAKDAIAFALITTAQALP